MVHRIVQFALASLLTTTLAAGAAWAQDEPAGGEEPAGDPTADPAGGEAGGEGEAGAEPEGGGGEMAAEAPKPLRFGVAALVALPLGDLADAAGFGIGVLGGVLYALNPKLAIAGHVGFVYHLPKEIVTDVNSTLIEIPIVAGVRYFVIPKLAIGADTGINIMRFSTDVDGAETDTNTRIPLAIHAGYMLNANMTVGAGLWIPNLLLTEDGEDTQMEIVAYFGYLF